MVGVVGFLLVDNLLELFEKRVLQESRVFGESQKDSHRLAEIQIAVNVFLVKFGDNCLLEFRTFDVSVGESQDDAFESRCIFTSESLNPFDSNGGDDCVEGFIDLEVPLPDLIEELFDMMTREELQVVLSD